MLYLFGLFYYLVILYLYLIVNLLMAVKVAVLIIYISPLDEGIRSSDKVFIICSVG